MSYADKNINQLREICKERKITGISGKKKQEIIEIIKKQDELDSSVQTNENIKINITEIQPQTTNNEYKTNILSLEKGSNYWYQKNKSDIPEYVKVIEIHRDGNDYYYTIQIDRIDNVTEKQTIGQYLFNLKTPPLFSILPDENCERIKSAYNYGFRKGQLLQAQKNNK